MRSRSYISMFTYSCLAISLAVSLGGCTKKYSSDDDSVNVSLRENIKGLDPIYSQDMYTNQVVTQIYEGLYSYHYLKRPLQLIPAMADGFPEVSKDGKTYTIKLKKDLRFQDDECFKDGKGRVVTAQDFVYSLKRLADPKNISPGYWVIDGKIKGLSEWVKGVNAGKANYDTPIEGLEAVDPLTLKIVLTEPYYQLLYVLAMNYSAAVPREAIEKYGDEFLNHAVGTGPYRLKKWVRGSKIFLERNSNYRDNFYPSDGDPGDKEAGLLVDAGKKLPIASKVTMSELPEDQPRWLNTMRGFFDYVLIPKDNFDNVIKNGALLPEVSQKGFRLFSDPDADTVYVAFNMKDKVIGKNKKLRQAISAAFDNNLFIKKFYNGRGVPANGPIPPGIDGFDPNLTNPYSYNLSKAKKLLAEAGFPNGKGLPEFTYDTTASTTARQITEYFVQAVTPLGLKFKVATNTWPQFLEKIDKQNGQVWGAAWGADYPDGQNFLQLFYSKNVAPGPNSTNYSNPLFDELYEKSILLPPSPDRTELYKKMSKIIVEDVPWVFNAHRKSYYIINSWIKNFKLNSTMPDYLMYMRVDPKLRSQQIEKL